MSSGSATHDDIVITGISGRFPESDSIEEFKQNLLEGVDLVTENDRRWPPGMYELPRRSGTLKDLSRFDSAFFGVHAKQANLMDPQVRMLLEVTHEAIVDSGFNPNQLRGSSTGVFVGVSECNTYEYLLSQNPDKLTGYELTGSCKAIFANRISYAFDFKGPSLTLDTSCSSSMYAFQQAITSMKTGLCDSAIVGATCLLLKPQASVQLNKLGGLSPNGTCRVFDDSADGYVRSEAIVVVFLQKATVSRRAYATVLGMRTNSDGYEEHGITFPSGIMQYKLMKATYEEIGVHPNEVAYVEAHGTGTKAGDPQETNSIADLFCRDRKSPLLIGSVKSNMGHAESASGLCALAKVIIAMESDIIPRNLHFNKPNTDIPALLDGKLKVVDHHRPWTGGIVGLNCFGFGGTNAHLVLCSNSKIKQKPSLCLVPRVVGVSGRTEEAVKYFLHHVNMYRGDEEFLALVDQVHAKNIINHSFRGYAVLADDPVIEVNKIDGKSHPICFIFSGMGSQWAGMAKGLMNVDIFRQSIAKCSKALEPFGLNLEDIILSRTDDTFCNVIYCFVSITAMQVALVDILKEIGIEPDFIVGHSVGEVACAYADGAFTAEQAVLTAYFRGRAILEIKSSPGAMAAIGLTWEQARMRCPPEIDLACHNSENSVTISGPREIVNKFVEQLQDENIFAKMVKSAKIALHSRHIKEGGPILRKFLEDIIPDPKPRSSRWLSSSILDTLWHTPLAQLSSAAYHTNNCLSPVLFKEALTHVPKDATFIEIAPSGLLQAILKRTKPSSTNITLLKRGCEDNVTFLASALGKIYAAGAEVKLGNMYPPITFPVSKGTPMIASMIEWDHSVEWSVVNFSANCYKSGIDIEIDLGKEENKFLTRYVVGGKVIFPVAGCITWVWKSFAKMRNENFEQMPILLEDVKFRRNIIISENHNIEFLIKIFEETGEFQICQGGSIAVTGIISIPDNKSIEIFNESQPFLVQEQDLRLISSDVYKELRLRGYDYEGVFRGIIESDSRGTYGKLKWEENWISFIDSMFQFLTLGNMYRAPCVPIYMQKGFINPKIHLSVVHSILKKDGINVNYSADKGSISSGGVFITGVKHEYIQRDMNSQTPKLEKYQFVPFHCSDMELTDALTVVSQLVLENCCGSFKLKIIQLVDERRKETNLVHQISEILEEELWITVEASILSMKSSSINNNGIRKYTTTVLSVLKESNAHLLIISDNSSDEPMTLVENAARFSKRDCFILLEKAKDVADIKQLNALGLEVVSSYSSVNKTSYVLLRQAVKLSDSFVINITENNFSWLEPLKKAMETAEDTNSKIYLYAYGEPTNGIVGMVNCLTREPIGGAKIRSVFIQDKDAPVFSLEDYESQLKQDLVHNVFKNKTWGTFRHLRLKYGSSAEIVQTEHACINTIIHEDYSSLKWIESSPPSLKVELYYIYYAGIHPIELIRENSKKNCALGIDFSGRDSEGRRVMGMAEGCLATIVQANPEFLWNVPETWTLEEAATIPKAYGISYYALIVEGNMKPGASILITQGASDIGLASISIALSMNCIVFTTVSNKYERVYLQKNYSKLKNDRIGYSYDSSFDHIIFRCTKGKGVDLILIYDDNFVHESLGCLRLGGQLLKIGSDVVQTILASDITVKKKIVQLVSAGIQLGVVRPLERIIFNEDEIESGFKFVASTQCIGRVLLKIREEECLRIQKPPCKTVSAIPRIYVDSDKSYIIVGGLGGFGLELANWLMERGAKHVVLTSRSGVRTGYQSLCLRKWKESGINVLVSTADASTKAGAEKILYEANELALVGGIFNLAVVVRDNLIGNQTVSDFGAVSKPKADACKQLDAASRILAPHLKYFVSFSSISSGRGNLGQSNYGFGNSAMERITEARNDAGFPGLVIQWGAIGDVGLLLESMGATNETDIGGTLPQRIESCLAVLDILLRQPHPIVSSMVVSDKRKVNQKNNTIADIIADILGIDHLNSVCPTATLAELGMDSLMGNEIKQALERNCDIRLRPKEIRNLTFGELQELNKSGE